MSKMLFANKVINTEEFPKDFINKISDWAEFFENCFYLYDEQPVITLNPGNPVSLYSNNKVYSVSFKWTRKSSFPFIRYYALTILIFSDGTVRVHNYIGGLFKSYVNLDVYEIHKKNVFDVNNIDNDYLQKVKYLLVKKVTKFLMYTSRINLSLSRLINL